MKKHKILLFIFGCFFSLSAYTNEIQQRLDSLADVQNYEPDQTLIKGLEQPRLSKEGNAVIINIEDKFKSKEFEIEVDKWQGIVSERMGVKNWKPLNELSANETVIFSDKPILFISSSIPKHVLRRYAMDLEKVQGVMVLRGGLDGLKYVMPTLEFISNVLKKNESCKIEPCEKYAVDVIIDPILFTEYGINKVPAFTIHGKENFTAYCNQEEPLNKINKLSYGDYSIKHHIKTIQKNDEYKNLIELL